MGTKRNPGAFDCYERAEPDEPIFVLLGRDKNAPELVLRWAAERAADGEDPAVTTEAVECAAAMRRWREDLDAPVDLSETERAVLRDCIDYRAKVPDDRWLLLMNAGYLPEVAQSLEAKGLLQLSMQMGMIGGRLTRKGLRLFTAVTVTRESHPNLWQAFQLIDADNGRPGSATWGPFFSPATNVTYDVPLPYARNVGAAEQELSTLAGPASDVDSQFTEFCIGEQSIEMVPGLETAGEILSAYFEGWPEPANA